MSDWNVDHDFASVVDGTVAVTLRRPGGGPSGTLAHALRKGVTLQEAAASGGHYTSADRVWSLPMNELPFDPLPGDQIVAANVAWTVLHVQTLGMESRVRCVTRNLVELHALTDLVNVERAEWHKSASGALEPTWREAFLGVRARIQPVTIEPDSQLGGIRTRATHRVYLAEDLRLTPDHRLLDWQGKRFLVLGYEKPARIDQLPVVTALLDVPAVSETS